MIGKRKRKRTRGCKRESARDREKLGGGGGGGEERDKEEEEGKQEAGGSKKEKEEEDAEEEEEEEDQTWLKNVVSFQGGGGPRKGASISVCFLLFFPSCKNLLPFLYSPEFCFARTQVFLEKRWHMCFHVFSLVPATPPPVVLHPSLYGRDVFDLSITRESRVGHQNLLLPLTLLTLTHY